MFDSMINYVTTFEFNSMLGILLYWVPLALCVVGYTLRTAKNYMKDRDQRDSVENGAATSYYPTDTVGTLIGRAFVTVCPLANIWAAAFDVAPSLFKKFFDIMARVFDQPLVPPPKKKQA